MGLEAKYRLVSTSDEFSPWPVMAMPQLVEEEHESDWFDPYKFAILKKHTKLFEFGGHEVWSYTHPSDVKVRMFVALRDGIPFYINEVHSVDLDLSSTSDARRLWVTLSRYSFWMQVSVAYAKEADRTSLKGLATKIFWDYLASDGNVAITDSQQTTSARDFWQKILTRAYYLTVIVSPIGDTHTLHINSSATTTFTDHNHVQYDIRKCWRSSEDGKTIRVLVTRNLR